MTPRAAPPLRKVVLRITFIAPLWGVLIAVSLMGLAFTASAVASGDAASAFDAFGFILIALLPGLFVGYPIGLVIAFFTALLLVLVVRRFGWSRRNALATAAVPGLLIGGASLVSGNWLTALGILVTCVGAGALTWGSSLRSLLRGSSEDIADIFS